MNSLFRALGKYGIHGTLKALRQFRAAEHIKADGIMGWHSWNLLQKRMEKRREKPEVWRKQ